MDKNLGLYTLKNHASSQSSFPLQICSQISIILPRIVDSNPLSHLSVLWSINSEAYTTELRDHFYQGSFVTHNLPPNFP